MGNYFNKEEEILYIPYYSVFDIKEQEQGIGIASEGIGISSESIPLKKKNSYYTTACKSYDAVKQHGIDLLK